MTASGEAAREPHVASPLSLARVYPNQEVGGGGGGSLALLHDSKVRKARHRGPGQRSVRSSYRMVAKGTVSSLRK